MEMKMKQIPERYSREVLKSIERDFIFQNIQVEVDPFILNG
jgi:hypothetical protein